tara:strand:- start:29 stop:571 length:543 start_codon:yes stop_codon:yes gene_type:complete
MSELRTNRIVPRDGLVSGAGIGGGIIQIKSTNVTAGTFYTNSTSFTDITGMSVTITPTRSDSKIFIMSNLCYGGSDNFYGGVKLLRDSTAIGLSTWPTGIQTAATFTVMIGDGDYGQYKTFTAAHQILDTPSTTSAVTYKLQVMAYASSASFYLNRPWSGNNSDYIFGGSSTITAMEVSG